MALGKVSLSPNKGNFEMNTPVSPNTIFDLKLTAAQLALVYEALAQQPYGRVAQVFRAVEAQVFAQTQPPPEPSGD